MENCLYPRVVAHRDYETPAQRRWRRAKWWVRYLLNRVHLWPGHVAHPNLPLPPIRYANGPTLVFPQWPDPEDAP